MAIQITGPKKPRKLTKPLKSTLKSVRERCKEFFDPPPPEEVIVEMALSEDQEIENWKAGLILVLDDSLTKQKKPATSKKTATKGKKAVGKVTAPAKTKTKRSAR